MFTCWMLGLLGGAVWPSAASAAPDLSGHQLDVALVTDVPILVGGAVTWESPRRYRGRFTGGVMPGAYVDATNAAMVGFDIYSETVADIIDSALERTVVLHLQGGWRPVQARPMTVWVGYQFWGLGGSTTDLGVFADVMDDALYEAAQDVTGDVDIAIRDHMLTAGIGREWVFDDRVVVGTSVGFSYSLAAPSRASATRAADNEVEQRIMDGVTGTAEDYLTYVFEEWVHLPTVGLSVGYRFR